MRLSHHLHFLTDLSIPFLIAVPQDAESVGRVLSKIDKANGYVMQETQTSSPQRQNPRTVNALFQAAFSGNEADYEHLASVQERYMGHTTGNTT